ncbi:MAG TPA: hypothetical protein VLH39_06100 [Magnetospirillaceae bacterium]|nr:hypothetical protein [Magnetospirillaceae bacterium]
MEQILNEIRLPYSDPGINAMAAGAAADSRDALYGMRFSQNEEYFLELPRVIEVPSFPIHHDVRRPEPSGTYLDSLRKVVGQLVKLLPATFRDLVHFFDPADPLKPAFYHLYKVQEVVYVYTLRMDLLNRPLETETTVPGTNATTPSYRTRRIYLESELIPLDGIERADGRIRALRVRQLVSNTWIGETGKGYQLRGIWMDADLSKLFSRLFLPVGKRTHPFLPFFCKYKTVCSFVPVPEAPARKRALPVLHRALNLLAPEMERIQESLKNSPFSENAAFFRELRDRVPEAWKELYHDVSIRPYLNARDMKEYELDYPRT